jgi:hypothetical protein
MKRKIEVWSVRDRATSFLAAYSGAPKCGIHFRRPNRENQVRTGLSAGTRIRTSGPTLGEDAGAENIGKQMEDPARVAVVRGHRGQVICNTQNGRVHDFAAKSPWSKEAVDCQ